MKKLKSLAIDIDGRFWVGSKVFSLTSYGLPVRVKIEMVDILIDKKKGKILGYFSEGCRFTPENLLSEKEVKDAYPDVINIPDFTDYVNYEVSKAFNKNKDFVNKYEKINIFPYLKKSNGNEGTEPNEA